VILEDDVEDLIAPHTRKKGDLSRIINEALKWRYDVRCPHCNTLLKQGSLVCHVCSYTLPFEIVVRLGADLKETRKRLRANLKKLKEEVGFPNV